MEEAKQTIQRVGDEIARVVVGQRDLVDGLLVALLSGGHALVEGVPGLAKTTAVRTVAQVPSYTSHVIRTRNLDMAVAGDFDGDGHIELLLPNQARTELGAIRRSGDGAEVAWTLPVDGLVSTNLAGVTLADGNLAVGVGRDDGTLRLWLPGP